MFLFPSLYNLKLVLTKEIKMKTIIFKDIETTAAEIIEELNKTFRFYTDDMFGKECVIMINRLFRPTILNDYNLQFHIQDNIKILRNGI